MLGRYGQRVSEASVAGVTNVNPWGTATAGMVLPRENRGPEWLPRRVSTRSTGGWPWSTAGCSAMTHCTNPVTVEGSPLEPVSDPAPSTTSTAAGVRHVGSESIGARLTVSAFHCSGMLQRAAN
ncbi:hypothetical protein [Microbacterium sp. ISL-103]|uniref:hypothetical protein n=1 Tax=Microbacterium sp. ISL-103 TaxID=2819156 RepID=UPI00288AFF3B|nr:hypothetical protein [Microbacterium sp. ISL-103]